MCLGYLTGEGDRVSCEKDWVDITSALLTPVIAILGSVIATLQWRLNRARFRDEIFEKRYGIFEATQLYLSRLISTAKMNNDDRIEFLRNTKGAFVLFDKKIVQYLNDLHKKSIELNLHQQKDQHELEAEDLNWLSDQIQNIDEVFQGQLKIE